MNPYNKWGNDYQNKLSGIELFNDGLAGFNEKGKSEEYKKYLDATTDDGNLANYDDIWSSIDKDNGIIDSYKKHGK